MLRIISPGKTAGPIGLKFFVDIHGWPGVLQTKKNSNFFLRAMPGIHIKDFRFPAPPPALTKLYIARPRIYLRLFFSL